MTDEEFLALWRVSFGYDDVSGREAVEFKRGIVPEHMFSGYLNDLKSRTKLFVRTQVGWRAVDVNDKEE